MATNYGQLIYKKSLNIYENQIRIMIKFLTKIGSKAEERKQLISQYGLNVTFISDFKDKTLTLN